MTSALLDWTGRASREVGDTATLVEARSDSMAPEKIGDRVRRYRRLRKMTQPALAEAASTDKGYIGRLEAGRISDPGLDVLTRLARALGVRVRELADPGWYDEPEALDIEGAILAHPKWDDETKETVIRIIRLADASLDDDEEARRKA